MRTTKIKITDQDHVQITQEYQSEKGEGMNRTEHDRHEHPHPDFVEALNELKAHIIYNWPEPFLKSVDIEDLPSEVLDLVKVNGISYDPEHDSQGVTIKGMIRLRKNFTAINVPKILYSEESYQHMDSLKGSVAKIVDEANKYLNGKAAQLDVFDGKAEVPEKPKRKPGRPRKAALEPALV